MLTLRPTDVVPDEPSGAGDPTVIVLVVSLVLLIGLVGLLVLRKSSRGQDR